MAINDDPASLSQDYIFMNDIDVVSQEDLGVLEFKPIGNSASPFKVSFDGNNFTRVMMITTI